MKNYSRILSCGSMNVRGFGVQGKMEELVGCLKVENWMCLL